DRDHPPRDHRNLMAIRQHDAALGLALVVVLPNNHALPDRLNHIEFSSTLARSCLHNTRIVARSRPPITSPPAASGRFHTTHIPLSPPPVRRWTFRVGRAPLKRPTVARASRPCWRRSSEGSPGFPHTRSVNTAETAVLQARFSTEHVGRSTLSPPPRSM